METPDKIIQSCDPIDLLSKLSYLKWLMMTDAFSDREKQPFAFLEVKYALHYVMAYLLSHKLGETAHQSILYERISALICTLAQEEAHRSLNEETTLDKLSEKLQYTQKDSGELLPLFYEVPFRHILEGEDDILSAKYGCNSTDILNDFAKLVGAVNNSVSDKGMKVSDFVNRFNDYCNSSVLIIPKNTKSYDLFKTMSGRIGQFAENEFDQSYPISLIKKFRKLFIEDNDILYCPDLELVPNLIVRCVERTMQQDKKQNPEWDLRMKERTEELVNGAFLHYFKGGTYHANSEFGQKEKGESDGLFEFLGHLFIIEVKAGKLSPDPVESNNTTVHQSYKATIGKGERQCDKIVNHILERGGKFKEDGHEFRLNYDIEHIIKLVISFEDLSAVLPDENVQAPNHTILMTYFDLLIVLDYISEPILSLKYFLERRKALEHRLYISDEMIYLCLFSYDMNFSNRLNSQPFSSSADNSTNIVLDPHSFTHEIEMHYTQPERYPKPKIHSNEFQRLVLTALNGNEGISSKWAMPLLMLPTKFGDQLMSLFQRNNYHEDFAPQVAMARFENGKHIAVMVSKRHIGKQRYVYYAIANRFFRKHGKVKEIVSLIVDGQRSRLEEIDHSRKELNYQKTLDALQQIEAKFGFRQKIYK